MSPTDRRVKILQLTDAGLAARARLHDRMSEPPAPLLSLSTADLRTLDAVLSGLAPDPRG